MKSKLIFLLLATFILVVSFRISQNRSLSLRFVDEEDHIAFGYYINQGYRLHEQLQNNHQPLVYFASAAIQKFSDPDNLLILVKRHRQAMFFYGALWSIILVWRFTQVGLIFVLFFEFLKYYLFGNLLLLDSLAAYPAVYLLLTAASVWYRRLVPNPTELVFLGLNTWLIFFTLIPLWPWLALLWIGLIIKLKLKLVWPLLSFLFLTALLFSFYSPAAWWHETIYNNLKYAIPALNEIKTLTDKLKLVLFPFLGFVDLSSLQAKFLTLFFTGYLALAIRNRRLFWLYPILILANTRVINPAAVYYTGFHLLPYLGILIALFAFNWQALKFKPLFILAGGSLLLNPAMPYWFKTNLNEEYYINYSLQEDFNFAVRAFANDSDRLAALNNKPLIYWNSGAKPATRQLVYYAWEPNVPELRADYEQVFYGDNPPEIIYGDKETELLAAKYTNILKDGKPTLLFIRTDRYAQITDSQWAALETRGFAPPSAND